MLDFAFIGAAILFFALCMGIINFFEALARGSE